MRVFERRGVCAKCRIYFTWLAQIVCTLCGWLLVRYKNTPLWSHTNVSKSHLPQARFARYPSLHALTSTNSVIKYDSWYADHGVYWIVGSFWRLIWDNTFLVALRRNLATNGMTIPILQTQHWLWDGNISQQCEIVIIEGIWSMIFHTGHHWKLWHNPTNKFDATSQQIVTACNSAKSPGGAVRLLLDTIFVSEYE